MQLVEVVSSAASWHAHGLLPVFRQRPGAIHNYKLSLFRHLIWGSTVSVLFHGVCEYIKWCLILVINVQKANSIRSIRVSSHFSQDSLVALRGAWHHLDCSRQDGFYFLGFPIDVVVQLLKNWLSCGVENKPSSVDWKSSTHCSIHTILFWNNQDVINHSDSPINCNMTDHNTFITVDENSDGLAV